jgi:hypothetical protein
MPPASRQSNQCSVEIYHYQEKLMSQMIKKFVAVSPTAAALATVAGTANSGPAPGGHIGGGMGGHEMGGGIEGHGMDGGFGHGYGHGDGHGYGDGHGRFGYGHWGYGGSYGAYYAPYYSGCYWVTKPWGSERICPDSY